MQYVIIGGGIAGTTAAEELRKIDATAEITIVDEEAHPCYSRVLLPHYINGKVPREKVFLRTEKWYIEQRLERLAGTMVTKIDIKNQFVTIHSGRELPYDKLLLATGGQLNLAATDPKGVCYLQTLDDADGIVARLAEVKRLPHEQQRAVIIGGGFICLEFINIFALHGIATTVVVRGNGFWSRLLSAEAKKVLAKQAIDKGVRLLTGQVEAMPVGETEVIGVELADGTVLPASMVGVGLGTHADKSLFMEAGVAIKSGILANSYLETNLQNVLTAGDAAEFSHPLLGRQLHIGNWLNAQMQGKAVAKTIAGERTEFSLVSSYSTNLLGMHIVFIGDTNPEFAEVKNHKVTETSCVDLYLRSGKIVGAVLVGDLTDRASVTKAIQTGESTL